jgi:hypothetical protein
MALGFTQPLIEINTRKCSWEVERRRRVRLTTSPPSVSRFAVESTTCHNPIGIHGLLLGQLYFTFTFFFMGGISWVEPRYERNYS